MEEAIEQAKALRKAMKAGHVAAQVNISLITVTILVIIISDLLLVFVMFPELL